MIRFALHKSRVPAVETPAASGAPSRTRPVGVPRQHLGVPRELLADTQAPAASERSVTLHGFLIR